MNDELLQRIYDYIDGELDLTTRKEFEERLARDDALRRAVEDARELEGHLQASFPRHAFPAPRMVPAKPKSRWRVAPLAAAACVMLCGGLAWAAVETGVWDALVAVVSGPRVESDTTHENLADERDAASVADVASAKLSQADVTETTAEAERIDTASGTEVKHVIRGRVVSIDGPPIANARVSFSYDEQKFYEGEHYRSTVTDGDGRFEQPFHPDTWLFVEADDFQIADRLYLPTANTIEATVQLLPLVSATGHVRNANGEPLAGASVYATFGGRPGRTDVDGRFSMMVESSEYGSAKNLVVAHPEYASQMIDFSRNEVNAWLLEGAMLDFNVQRGGVPVGRAEVAIGTPGVYLNTPGPITGHTDVNGKVTVGPVDIRGEWGVQVTHPDGTILYVEDESLVLGARESTQIDVEFPYPLTHTIHSRVVLDGAPVADASIQIQSDDLDIHMKGTTDADGSHSWNVASGTYSIYAHTRDGEGRQIRGGTMVSTAGGSSEQHVEIELSSWTPRTYSIYDREGKPVRSFFVDDTMHLHYEGDVPIESLRDARLLLSDDRQWAGYPVPGDQTKREWIVNLELPLDDGASGRVVDASGDPVAEAFVFARINSSPYKTQQEETGDTYRPSHSVSARTDEDGRYRLSPLLADTEYAILVRHRGYTNRISPSGHWAAAHYQSSSGGDIDDIVLVQNDAYIEGVVRYDTGRRLEDVAVISIDSADYSVMGTQSLSGHFRLGVPKGEYTLSATLNPVERTGPIIVEAPTDSLVITLPDPETYMTAEDMNAMEGLEAATNGLKQWGIIFKMFAGENKDRYPSVGMEYGIFCPELDGVLYPEYLTDLRIAEPLLGNGAVRTVYTGYTMTTEIEGLAFLDAYSSLGPEGIYDMDIKTASGYGTGGSDKIFKLREGIERFLITDINDPGASSNLQSMIPIVWEMPNDRANKGGLVLYLDGHVEWVDYPGPFPMTEAFIQNLARIIGESDEAVGR